MEPTWTVGRVDLKIKEQRVEVYLEREEGALWACPQCGKKPSLYDHKEDREWRHLSTMKLQTWVHAKVPRVECHDH